MASADEKMADLEKGEGKSTSGEQQQQATVAKAPLSRQKSVFQNYHTSKGDVRVHPDAVGDVEMLLRNQGGDGGSDPVARRLARRNTTVKTKDHYRRKSIVIERLEKRLVEKGEAATKKEKALLRSLKKAKESGFVSKRSLVGFSVMGMGENVVDNPYAVFNLPLDIQKGFRMKIFAILALQLAASFFLTCLLLYTNLWDSIMVKLSPYADFNMTAYNISRLNTNTTLVVFNVGPTLGATVIACIVSVVALCVLYCAKYTHPINYLSLLVFTFALAFGLSVLSAYLEPFQEVNFESKPHISAAVIGLFIMVCSSVGMVHLSQRKNSDGENLWNIMDAGAGAWFCSTALTVALYFIFKSQDVPVTGGAGLAVAIATTFILSLWVSYDASCLCNKMSPDEFMSAVVYFYTDLFILIGVILLIIACFCMGEGGGFDGGFGGDFGGVGGVEGVASGGAAVGDGGLYLGVGGMDGAMLADSGYREDGGGGEHFAQSLESAVQ